MKGEKKKIKKKQTTVKDLEACIKKKEEKIQDQDGRILILERKQMAHKEHIVQVLWYFWVGLCGIFTVIYFYAGYYLGQSAPMFWNFAESAGHLPTFEFLIISFFIVMTSFLTWWISFRIFEGIEECL